MNSNDFPPTDDAASARLDALDLAAYARSRNHVNGTVSGLSPYLTHGILRVPDVIATLRHRGPFPLTHKFAYELAWREYFHHLWTRRGEAILSALGPLPGRRYRPALPEDLLKASTGVLVIDHAVRTLYGTGYLHNHLRLWLASYAVHFRKVDWRTGADWMYGHLLDGDLPSNHLSWQWVAGTLTGKPYLFNAENVERHAPALESRGTVLDQGYDALEHLAASGDDVGPDRAAGPPITPPPLLDLPADLGSGVNLPETPFVLSHPWDLARHEAPGVVLLIPGFHRRWPWSAKRWAFLRQRLALLRRTALRFEGNALPTGTPAHAVLADHPLYDPVLASAARCAPAPRHFANPVEACRSFSAFWRRVFAGTGGTTP